MPVLDYLPLLTVCMEYGTSCLAHTAKKDKLSKTGASCLSKQKLNMRAVICDVAIGHTHLGRGNSR